MTRQEYLAALKDGRDNNEKWSTNPNQSRQLEVGDLLITLSATCERALWTLSVNGDILSSGARETMGLARTEALQYAEHYVRTIIDTVHA